MAGPSIGVHVGGELSYILLSLAGRGCIINAHGAIILESPIQSTWTLRRELAHREWTLLSPAG